MNDNLRPPSSPNSSQYREHSDPFLYYYACYVLLSALRSLAIHNPVMGVSGLWTVLKPCARPIKLETLNRRRLAIDASIWIYQFLKAVRDKEGNALRNAHIVGFFRRICKLLYFGIKPVFVFDGGAPILKRQTIANRRKHREGRREDATRTATRLLAVQLKKLAEEETAKRKGNAQNEEQAEKLPEEFVYADEVLMSAGERKENRQFRKKDAYHLPDMDISLEAMGAPNDPRIMSHEELEEYARHFHTGENVNLYDFSKIDFDSPFFLSLPPSDRYNILNAARLRSRLRMGYSKEQLDTMFPNRMAFSRFQIERVAERNDLTQRLMSLSGMNGADAIHGSTATSRIAGERNKEYILVKDNSVEGGWALGVLGNKEGSDVNKPIDIDRYGKQIASDDDGSEDEAEGFEDVPIEGLNRLPKLPIFDEGAFDESIRQDIVHQRQALYDSRKRMASDTMAAEDGLFVGNDAGLDELFEPSQNKNEDEDGDLARAIQLSLEYPSDNEMDVDKVIGISSEDSPPRPGADTAEAPSHSDDDDDMDLFSALAQSKVSKQVNKNAITVTNFSGPLPFETLRVIKASGEPMQLRKDSIDDTAGGFEKLSKAPEKPQPLPPWFTGTSEKKQFIPEEDDDLYDGADPHRRNITNEISAAPEPVEVINVDSDEESFLGQAVQTEPLAEIGGNTLLQNTKATATNVEVTPPSPTKSLPVVTGDGGNKESRESHDQHISSNERISQRNANTSFREETSASPEFEDVEVSKLSAATHLPDNEKPELVNEMELVNDIADYSDPEDDELLHQLAAEAEEHARFASTLNDKSQAQNAHDFDQELKQLRSQQKKDRRDADEVNQIMVTECQQLLKLFGLPYITAPMEAEAQCAELVSLGLVDGIVTDDSDTFLFGGTRVYKNMFNQAKYVECYLTSDLEKEYALDRKKLISLAHLLGSDYTEGIPGIGPVTALEILSEFPSLKDFRHWWSQVQRGEKIPDDPHAAFRKKFKKSISKLFLPPSFPDERVDEAYQVPEVDSDPSQFQWGVPDLHAVRHFLMATVGWSPERTDEVLVPVIRDVNRREQEGTQSNITGFFQGPQGAGAFAPRRRPDGKSRMEKAFGRLRNEAADKQKTRQSSTEANNSSRPAVAEASTGVKEPPKKSGRRRRSNSDQSLADGATSTNQDRLDAPARKRSKAKKRL
ncbi:DNA repair protein rad2 [Myotisia sp. PD_48]|nr:DNA repair protein rad2 [Myotisia sp. PD_48]